MLLDAKRTQSWAADWEAADVLFLYFLSFCSFLFLIRKYYANDKSDLVV